MSGHSKWANIKRKKQAKDLIKGNIFSKLSRLITIAVAEGGGVTDPENNVKLRLAIEKAKSANMPKENIARAIEKGTGPERSALKEIIYEAFAPGGITILIQATTDNSNRTLTEIKNILERKGGKLGSPGSVIYQFRKCGYVTIAKNKVEENRVFELAQSLNAFDIDQDDSHFFIFFPFDQFGKLKSVLAGVNYEKAEVDYLPNLKITPENTEVEKSVFELVEALESQDDIHKVFTNLG